MVKLVIQRDSNPKIRRSVNMKEYLFQVNMMYKATDELIRLFVWASNGDEATYKVVSVIGGYNGSYVWRGTGPVYENNCIVSRMI